MEQIEDYQQRIEAALERIRTGIGPLAEKAASARGSAEIEQALEEERLTNAQLEERLRALRAKHDDDIAELKARLDRSAEIAAMKAELDGVVGTMARLDMDLQRLRAANDQLRKSNAALREANAAGLNDPGQINQAMLAEIEALRAARAADLAEAGAIMARLGPLVADTEPVPSEENEQPEAPAQEQEAQDA